jgi:hypothetical protein
MLFKLKAELASEEIVMASADALFVPGLIINGMQ